MDTTLALAPVVVLSVGFVAYCLIDLFRHEPRVFPLSLLHI